MHRGASRSESANENKDEKPKLQLNPTEAHASPWGHFHGPSLARARGHIPRRLRTRALLPSISCIVSFEVSRTPKRASSVGDWRRDGGARPEDRYEAGRRDARVPEEARQRGARWRDGASGICACHRQCMSRRGRWT